MCSSDTNQQSPASTTVGSPWSMPNALRPASSTPQPLADRRSRWSSRNSAFSKPAACGTYSVSIRQYEPAWSSVTQVLMVQVPVPPPDTTSPPTAACASSSSCHRALDEVGLGVAGLAHEVALVAHDPADLDAVRAGQVGEPAGVGGVAAAAGEADVDVDQHLADPGGRGRRDGLVGVDGDGDAGRAGLDDAGVRRRRSSDSLASSRSSPRPAAAMPDHLPDGGAAERRVAGVGQPAGQRGRLERLHVRAQRRPRPARRHRGHVAVEGRQVDEQRGSESCTSMRG